MDVLWENTVLPSKLQLPLGISVQIITTFRFLCASTRFHTQIKTCNCNYDERIKIAPTPYGQKTQPFEIVSYFRRNANKVFATGYLWTLRYSIDRLFCLEPFDSVHVIDERTSVC